MKFWYFILIANEQKKNYECFENFNTTRDWLRLANRMCPEGHCV